MHIGKPPKTGFTYMHIPYGGYRGWRSTKKRAALGHPIGGLLDPGGSTGSPSVHRWRWIRLVASSMSLGSESISAYRRTSSRS